MALRLNDRARWVARRRTSQGQRGPEGQLWIARVLIDHGAHTAVDLRELWSRIVFNMLVSNNAIDLDLARSVTPYVRVAKKQVDEIVKRSQVVVKQ